MATDYQIGLASTTGMTDWADDGYFAFQQRLSDAEDDIWLDPQGLAGLIECELGLHIHPAAAASLYQVQRARWIGYRPAQEHADAVLDALLARVREVVCDEAARLIDEENHQP